MKRYIYNGKTFDTKAAVRQAIWETEHKIFGEEFPEDLDVVVEEYEASVTQEVLAKRMRAKRDHLLSACDFYLMPDYPATEEGLAEVKAYRQALRDITKQYGFPDSVVFPEIPAVLA